MHNSYKAYCDTFFVHFRVMPVQRVVLERQEVQDFRGCQGRGAYQDLQAQREIQ